MVYPALLPLMRTPRLPVVDRTDAPSRFKWTRPFRQKTKSGFCVCAITFQTQSTSVDGNPCAQCSITSPHKSVPFQLNPIHFALSQSASHSLIPTSQNALFHKYPDENSNNFGASVVASVRMNAGRNPWPSCPLRRTRHLLFHTQNNHQGARAQWRTEGVFGGVQPPPPEIPKFWQSRTGLQIEQKMFSVPIPTS